MSAKTAEAPPTRAESKFDRVIGAVPLFSARSDAAVMDEAGLALAWR